MSERRPVARPDARLDARLDSPPGILVRLAARLARALLPLPLTPPLPEQLRSVLVVRTDDRVGNALLTIPLARALARRLPGARVDLLLAARRAQVAQGLPGLSVIPWEKRDAFRRPWRFLRALAALRRYDAVIDAAHWHAFSLTSALLSRWAARRWVVGAERGPSLVYSATVPPPLPGVPEVVAKVALLRGLGLEPPPTPALETSLGRAPWPLGERFAALNPGARKADHRWPAERFSALARGLRERHGLRSIVLWGPGERDLALRVCEGGAAELGPATDLEGLASAFRAAALVVTNDTGPMHLAVACGAPVLAIFLSPDGLRWAHPGPRFEAVHPGADLAPALEAAARLLA